MRLALPEPKMVLREVDWPKSGEPRTPMGGPRLTWLKMLLEPMSMPSEYLRSICFLTIFEGLAAALESVLLSLPTHGGRVPLVGSAGL